MPKRIVIAAGGTGGHFYPGFALAQTLKARGFEPLVLLKKDDPLAAVLEKADITFLEIDLIGLPRRPSPRVFLFLVKLAKSLRLLSRVMNDFKPDVCVGMGGYLSFPMILAARRKAIACAIHESNSVLGLANRLSLGLGAKLFWGLPPQNTSAASVVTGTPIRPVLFQKKDRRESKAALGLHTDEPVLLIFGGSQGAASLNYQLPAVLASLISATGKKVQILHLAGKNGVEGAEAAYAAADLKAKVFPFLDAMETAYGAADLAICRAGASTLAELAAQRMPAILIPYPAATAGHQEKNARVFERAGAARVVLESRMPGALRAALDELFFSNRSAEKLKLMTESFGRLGLPKPKDAVSRLADSVEKLSGGDQ